MQVLQMSPKKPLQAQEQLGEPLPMHLQHEPWHVSLATRVMVLDLPGNVAAGVQVSDQSMQPQPVHKVCLLQIH